MSKTLKIDNELRDLLPALPVEVLKELEERLINEGCLSPIITWNGYIVDGHNRYGICKRNKIEFKTIELAFDSKEDVMIWMISTQASRRNLSAEQMAFFRGKQYNLVKKKQGGQEENKNAIKNEGATVAGSFSEKTTSNTAKKIAEQHKVAERTIFTDGHYAEGIDKIEFIVGGDIKNKILSKDIKLSKKEVIAISQLPEHVIEGLFNNIDKLEKFKEKFKAIQKLKEKRNEGKKEEDTQKKKDSETKLFDENLERPEKENSNIDKVDDSNNLSSDICETIPYDNSISEVDNTSNTSLVKTKYKDASFQQLAENIKNPNLPALTEIIPDVEINTVNLACTRLLENLEFSLFQRLDAIEKFNSEDIAKLIYTLDTHIDEVKEFQYRIKQVDFRINKKGENIDEINS